MKTSNFKIMEYTDMINSSHEKLFMTLDCLSPEPSHTA